jgi:hypothetical protein
MHRSPVVWNLPMEPAMRQNALLQIVNFQRSPLMEHPADNPTGS